MNANQTLSKSVFFVRSTNPFTHSNMCFKFLGFLLQYVCLCVYLCVWFVKDKSLTIRLNDDDTSNRNSVYLRRRNKRYYTCAYTNIHVTLMYQAIMCQSIGEHFTVVHWEENGKLPKYTHRTHETYTINVLTVYHFRP